MADMQSNAIDTPHAELLVQLVSAETPTSTTVAPAKRWAPRPATLPNAGFQRIRRTPGLPQACIDLFKSHGLLRIASVLQSFDEGFTHAALDEKDADSFVDVYANTTFHVAYLIRDCGRDQIQVRWLNAAVGRSRNDGELLALARQIATYLGGGTNLRLIEIPAE